MDSILGGLKSATGNEPNKEQDHQSSAPSDLLSSAKVVAEATQSVFRNETDKVDKAKVSDAAEDLLGAASKYGKLEGKPMGQYVEKAESYLHQYHSSSQPSTTTKPSEPSTTTEAKPPSSDPAPKDADQKSGSGVGDYLKMAQGFLNKD